MWIIALSYESLSFFFHPRLNFETFQNLDAATSDFADTIRTVSDSADPLRTERIDKYGPSVASAESESVFVNGA